MMNFRMVLEVARWEFFRLFKLRDMVASLLVTVLIGLGYTGGSALIERGLDRKARVAVLNAEILPFEVSTESGIEIVFGERHTDAALREAVARGEIDGLLILHSADEAELVVSKQPRWEAELADALAAARRGTRLRAADLSAEELAEILAPVRIEVRYQETSGKRFDLAEMVAAAILAGLMLMGIVLGSTYLFIGIASEKQLRVTEQVVSAIHPQTWIDGKILGHSAMTLVSIVNLGIGALLSNEVVKLSGGGIALPSFAGNPLLLLLFTLFSLLGFFLWFTFFAAVAATVEDPNTSSRSALLFLPFLPLGLSLAAVIKEPDAWPIKILGIFPLTSPTVMPMRLCLTNVASWEVLLAVMLLLGSIWLLRRVAGKVFAFGILMYGKELSWSEISRWLREA
jgi:ABC-2 type transport system permease protein